MQTLEYKENGHVGHLVLNRPEKRNCINLEVARDLSAVVDNQLANNNRIKVLIISGKGTVFCGGADLGAFLRLRDREDDLQSFLEGGQRFMEALGRISQFVIAAVKGAALGGGLELALACDYIIVEHSPEKSLGLPEVTFGLMPGAGGTQRLPQRVPPGMAKRLVMCGERLTPAESVSIGLVDEVAANALQAAEDLAVRFADVPLHAMGNAKRAIQAAQRLDLDLESRLFLECLHHDESKRRMEGFFQAHGKRT